MFYYNLLLPLQHVQMLANDSFTTNDNIVRQLNKIELKRDVRKAGEEEDWKKKTRDRGGWKRLSDEAVKKLRAAPHP